MNQNDRRPAVRKRSRIRITPLTVLWAIGIGAFVGINIAAIYVAPLCTGVGTPF